MKVARKKPILSPYATSSIFPENSYVSPNAKKKGKYYELASLEIRAHQRKMYEEFERNVNSTNSPKKLKKHVQLIKRNFDSTSKVNNEIEEKKPAKRKVEGVDDVATGDIKSAKQPKINDLYDHFVNAIHEKKNVSKYLTKAWFSNVHDGGCILWTLWKEDCSDSLKRIVLYKDLKVDCYLAGKSICLPEMSTIEKIENFEKLMRTVSNLNTCMGVKGDLGKKDCLGFVILKREGGRPQLRCAPCSKLVRNFRKRKGSDYTTRKKKNYVKSLQLRCSVLHRKSGSLKLKLRDLKRNVRSLKVECANANEKAVEKAINKLPVSEQPAVRACFAASKVKSLKAI